MYSVTLIWSPRVTVTINKARWKTCCGVQSLARKALLYGLWKVGELVIYHTVRLTTHCVIMATSPESSQNQPFLPPPMILFFAVVVIKTDTLSVKCRTMFELVLLSRVLVPAEDREGAWQSRSVMRCGFALE